MKDFIEEILGEYGLLPKPIVGGRERNHALPQIPQERFEQLYRDLESVRKKSRSWASLVIIGHFLVFFIVAVMAWVNRTNIMFLAGILATGTGIYALLLSSLSGFWKDTVATDLLITVLPDLSEDGKIKILQNYLALKTNRN